MFVPICAADIHRAWLSVVDKAVDREFSTIIICLRERCWLHASNVGSGSLTLISG